MRRCAVPVWYIVDPQETSSGSFVLYGSHPARGARSYVSGISLPWESIIYPRCVTFARWMSVEWLCSVEEGCCRLSWLALPTQTPLLSFAPTRSPVPWTCCQPPYLYSTVESPNRMQLVPPCLKICLRSKGSRDGSSSSPTFSKSTGCPNCIWRPTT